MMHGLLNSLAGIVLTIALAPPALAAPFAYITNRASDTVTVVDVATNIVVATIAVGRVPHGVTANPFGTRVYVLNTLDDTVSVIDAATRTVIATVPVGAGGGNAAGLAINADGTRVYVANPQDNTLSLIDTATNMIAGPPVAVGEQPMGVAVSPSGAEVYVANYRGNSLSIVDAAANVQVAGLPVGSAPRGVTVHPSGRVYVATADGLTVVDPSTRTVVSTVAIPGAHSVTASADGASLYVTCDENQALLVIDAQTHEPVGSPIDLGGNGAGVSVTRDGTRVVVASGDDRVSVVDAGTQTVVSALNGLSRPAAFGAFITDVPPVATPQSVVTAQNNATNIVLAAEDADNDPLQFSVVTGPAHGTISGIPPALTYTPDPSFSGVDTFAFSANDGATDSNVATVSVRVRATTKTTVVSNPSTSAYGQPVTLTARVSSSDELPAGHVELFDGATLIGSAELNDGTAELRTSSIEAGTRAITAVYAATEACEGSTSPVWTQTVTKASGTATLTVSVLTPQYSDLETFRATFTPSVSGGPAPAKVSFKVGTQIIAEATPTIAGSTYQYTWTGQLLDPEGTTTRQMKPDFRAITANFADPNVAVTNPPPRAITIQKEEARVVYTGPTSVSLGGSATGTVVLSATVKDISAVTGDPRRDGYPGDIRNARVLFVDRSTNTILGTVNPTAPDADPTVGSATLNWTVNLGSAQSKTYTIGIIVSYYYNRNSTLDNTVVTVTTQ